MHVKSILTAIFFIIAFQAKADSWIDPTWRRMLDSSDVVALVQYTSNGEFRASAKILAIYKGQLKVGNAIWIGGFSNRYGPIDKMHKGDKYLVFLSQSEPNESRIQYWNDELKKDPSLKDFVEAYKQKQVYYVSSPTSGDLKVNGKKVQYDLTQTSYYQKQGFYSLKEFEDFLKVYYGRTNVEQYCSSLVNSITPASESDMNIQWLMQLFFLGYNKHHEVFNDYIDIDNSSSKYALAQLMGNIRSEQSRNTLIALLEDKNPMVQGEVVRQLKNEPADIVAPVLLKRLKSSSGQNFGPSNIMDPVMNTIDGGKVEIIRALGELKYKPAVPDLLLLLDTEDDVLFKRVIEALREIGTREYAIYINKHLENKTNSLIYEISSIIAEDSLVECLPAFKKFISTCDRAKHPDYAYTLSSSSGIGHFTDSTTVSFLLSEYERFFIYKDTLNSRDQEEWTEAFIDVFAELKLKEARPLIYRSLYDWFGINEEFIIYPQLLEIKKHLEDSLKMQFANKLASKGYSINHCIAFIQNAKETAAGGKQQVKFMVEATVPAIDNIDIILKELNLAQKNLYIRISNGWYYEEQQERFDTNFYSTPLYRFTNYVQAIRGQTDINFIQSLVDHGFGSMSFRDGLKYALQEIKNPADN